jgi:peptide/nickel transport system substrate-binding protein
VQPYTLDEERAAALLEEAGWVDTDGDGVREKGDLKLELSLITNSSNSSRMDLGAYIQDQLGRIGFSIDFQGLDFGTLLDTMDAQTFDMFILGWTGLGSDPHVDAFWLANQDVPGSGFNSGSFYNERVEELLGLGVTVPGCASEERAPYYYEIQEIMNDELPYIWVTGTVGNIAYNSNWNGIDPQPWGGSIPVYWNVNEWSIKSLTP